MHGFYPFDQSKPYAARTATEAGANGTSQNAIGIIAADKKGASLDMPLHSAALGQMAVHQTDSTRSLFQFVDASHWGV